MKRRQFLQYAAALSAATALQASDALAASSGKRHERIVVIGAGMAGLAAANRLVQAGLSVTVLESRDRIGGRIWTSRLWPDAPLDLGASWIHGVKGNPLSLLADAAGARRVMTHLDNALLYDTNGREASDAFEKYVDDTLDSAIEQVIARARNTGRDASLGSVLGKTFNAKTLTPHQLAAFNFYVSSNFEHEYSGETEAMSVQSFDDSDDFAGEDALFPEGYDALIRYLAKGLDIRTGYRVKAIAYTGSEVRISTDQGEFAADRVIVTLPLGILKSGAISFTPGLPDAKRQAIKLLGMGVLNKTYLRFPESFWPGQYDWLEYVSADKGQWCEWIGGFERLMGLPILLGFNAARFGREIEAWSDNDIVQSAMQTLRILYGQDIPEPDDYQITRWATDPHALGSYSYYGVGSHRKNRVDLAKPVANRLFFAGEATSPDSPATVHGAYLTGRRAAGEVLAI